MSSSPSPENLSPTTSPSFSPPITPLEPVPPPFLPPLPPGTTSPLAENPLPPGNATSAPPVPTLPPPLPGPVPEKAVSPPPISDSPPSPILSPPPIPSEPPSLPSPTFSPPPIPSEPTSPPSPIFSPPPFPSEPPSLPSPIFSPPPSPSEPPLSPPKLKRKPSLPSTSTPPPEAPEVPDSPSPEPQSTTAIPPSPTPSKSSPTPNGSPAPDSAAQPRRPAMNFPPFPKSPPSHPIPTPETTSPSSSVGFLPAALQLRKAGGGGKLSAGFIAGSAVASLVVVFAVAVAFVICCKRRRMNRKQKKKIFGVPHYHQDSFRTKDELGRREWGPPMHQQESFQYGKVLGYEELGRATGWFSEGNVAGEGGFGKVYKGVLECGREVAVKRLEAGGSQGEREFRAEVETIARVHHKHLLSLLGYSLHSSHRLLVYPFLPNNSLHFHLHQNHSHVMDWTTRLKVAIGSAKGLTYLHEDCNPRIIHRDIKASNILLDFDFEPKVSDFGLARSFSDTNTSHISTRVVGTFGYLAPEYASSGKVTEKSDVYSFGVVLLELITGHPPICDTDTSRNQGLVEWARPLLAEAMEGRDLGELVDPRLERSYDPDEMYRMVSCAAACVRHSSWLRPRMSQVVNALEGHTSLVDFHEGNSDLFASPLGSTHEHRDKLSRFRMAIEDQGYGKSSPYSGTTSEYGINPSISSGEATQTFRD